MTIQCPARRSLVFALFALAVSACSSGMIKSGVQEGSASVRPAFLSYDRLAIWPSLSAEYEDIFRTEYMGAFPSQRFVERRDILKLFGSSETFKSGDLMDSDARDRIREKLLVDAIVIPRLLRDGASSSSLDYEFKGGDRGTFRIGGGVLIKRFTIKVLDAETGDTTASAVSSLSVEMVTDPGVSFYGPRLIRDAIRRLQKARYRRTNRPR